MNKHCYICGREFTDHRQYKIVVSTRKYGPLYSYECRGKCIQNEVDVVVENEEHWCFVCNKKMTTRPRYWVHITNGNQFVPADYDGEDSQGCFPVGNDCAKKPEIKPHVFK